MEERRFGVATKGLIIKDDKILIIYKTAKEAENDPDPSLRKDQPGGRTEFGEDPNVALLREIKEEVGLEVKAITPINVWYYVKESFQLIGINYLCEWVSGDVVLSEEHESYEWLSLEDILERNWNDQEKFIKAFEYYSIYKSLK